MLDLMEMKAKFPELSVFFPTFNEAETIKEIVNKAQKILDKYVNKWEIIIVNDGSKDKTRQIAESLSKEDSRIRVINHSKNKGYGASLSTGFYNAKYKWIAFTDSDGQFDFSEIDKFIDKQKETKTDLVIGFYQNRKVSFLKKFTTKLWEYLIYFLFGLKVRDIDCGFKLISKNVIDRIPKLESERGAFISSELLIKAKKAGFKIVEIPVTHYPRLKGSGTGRRFNVIFKSFVDLFNLWRKTSLNRNVVILLGILIVAAFLRLYKIVDYMTFLGDEGRDVIVVRNLLVHGDPILIGPGTSIGGMYLGPLYYYMMAPALLLFFFSPVGPAVQIAVLGVITTWLLWFVGKKWFNNTAGLVAALLYAISPTVITFSRSSWNPNIMPFFALLSIFSIWKVWAEHNYRWLIVLGISFAFVLQSHYLGLLLMPTILIFWFLAKVPKRYTLYSIAIFAILMSPLLIFDLRHNFLNTRALYTFFTVRQETVSARPWNALPKIPELLNQIDTSLIGGKNTVAGMIASGVILITSIWLIIKKRSLILISWLVFALIGFGLYKQQIYDHYYGFIFVVPFLFVGAFISYFLKKRGPLMLLGIGVLVYFVIVNLIQNPLRFSPNKQLARSKDVAMKILSESGGKPFDLAVLAERNYEDGYRYFLEKSGAKVLHADRWHPETIGEELFVVCEMEAKKCDPTHSPKAEVANFGMSKIVEQWEIDGVIIYRLAHV